MSIEELAKEFILDCKVRNLSPRTVRNYEKQLVYFKRFLKEAQGVENLEELKPIHIKQFIAMLQEKKNKPSYVNDLLKVVKVLCRYAYEEGYAEELITKKVKNVKEPTISLILMPRFPSRTRAVAMRSLGLKQLPPSFIVVIISLYCSVVRAVVLLFMIPSKRKKVRISERE